MVNSMGKPTRNFEKPKITRTGREGDKAGSEFPVGSEGIRPGRGRKPREGGLGVAKKPRSKECPRVSRRGLALRGKKRQREGKTPGRKGHDHQSPEKSRAEKTKEGRIHKQKKDGGKKGRGEGGRKKKRKTKKLIGRGTSGICPQPGQKKESRVKKEKKLSQARKKD